MKLLRNARTLLSRPELAAEYLHFLASRVRHGGEAVRTFPEDRIQIGGLSGFGEFHSCAAFIDDRERQFLKLFPFGDGAFLDVGANLGLFSLLLARRFPDRLVHAFEPNPTTYAALQENLVRNCCSAVRAHDAAVADREGEIAFESDPVNRATTRIAEDGGHATDDGRQTASVPCVTLDGFCRREDLGRIALLKVDVEGYEDFVFRGAEHLLASGQARNVYYEVCPELTRRAGLAPEAASRRLLAYGYRIHILDGDGRLQPADLARISSATLENWVATAS